MSKKSGLRWSFATQRWQRKLKRPSFPSHKVSRLLSALFGMRVLVQYHSYIIPVDTRPTATVEELCASLPNAAKFHANICVSGNCSLTFRRVPLEAKQILDECRLIDGSLVVAESVASLYHSVIRLKTLTGRIYEYLCETDDSVGSAKRWISGEMGYPIDRVRLISGLHQRELKDHELFSQLDLPPEPVLFVLARRGGGG
jgi:hypothetical protein